MRITVIVAVAVCALVGAQALARQQQPPAKPDHMQHRFDDAAKFAKSFDDPARDAWQLPSRVIEALGLKGGMAVADIGAGTGYFSTRLARGAPDLTVYSPHIEPALFAN